MELCVLASVGTQRPRQFEETNLQYYLTSLILARQI